MKQLTNNKAINAAIKETEEIDLKPLKKLLLKEVGKPCKDYTPLCFQCEIWRTFNRLEALLDLLKLA